jgi:hypothetical protein
MSRDNPFSESVQKQAWVRQSGCCAHCGDDLSTLYDEQGVGWSYHHIVKEQESSRLGSTDFHRSADNCAVLCDDCHYVAHDGGRYRHDYITDPSYFGHLHTEQDAADRARWEQRYAEEQGRLEHGFSRQAAEKERLLGTMESHAHRHEESPHFRPG